MISHFKKLTGLSQAGIVASSGAFGGAQPVKVSDLRSEKARLDADIEEAQSVFAEANGHSPRRYAAGRRLDVLRGRAYVATLHLHGLLTREAAAKLREREARAQQKALSRHQAAGDRCASARAVLDSLVQQLNLVAARPETPAPMESGLSAAWADAIAAGRTEDAQRIAAQIEQEAHAALQREDAARVAHRARDAQRSGLQQRIEAAKAELDAAKDEEASALEHANNIGMEIAAIDADLANLAALEAEIRLRGMTAANGRRHSLCSFQVGQSSGLAAAMGELGAKAQVWDGAAIGRASQHFRESLNESPSLDDVLALSKEHPLKAGRSAVAAAA